ncbi:MAG: hypothetical protein IKS65_10670 [Bacteroidales bacterium]|nr:hypothetical protein [Bacteroidales bacterium]
MKKLLNAKALMLLLMVALAFGLTQCKKKNIDTITSATPIGEPVYINLYINNVGKHIVYPNTGIVEYSEGDKLYVGNDGKYIGMLTYHDGKFGGTIYGPQTTDYLHLYFVGGLELGDITPDEDLLTVGETTSFNVDISDQSSNLPVLSYNHSTQKYTEGLTTYGCMLLNKCGLVKFTLTNGTSEAVKVIGMKTGATINFADTDKPIVANGKRDAITLKSESETDKLAIFLPQDAVSDGLALINGVAYDCAVAAVANNDYITTNIIDNTTPSTDKVFTVSKNGNVVRFSLGNLQYDQTTQKYSFMEHQYDMVETPWQNVGDNYSKQNIVSLFGWGTGDNPTTTSSDVDDYETFKDWGDYCGDPTGGSYHWYTLSEDEWLWLIGNKNNANPGVNCREGNRFLNAQITANSKNYYGLIIFPDGYSGGIGSYSYNNYETRTKVSADDWSSMEAVGAVFLPAASDRSGDHVMSDDGTGHYWTSTPYVDHPYADNQIYQLRFDDGWIGTAVSPCASTGCVYGQSVRLVR